jgi:hypothetical protein
MSELREVIRLRFTVEARVQFQVEYEGQMEEKSAPGRFFSEYFSFLKPEVIPLAPHSPTYHSGLLKWAHLLSKWASQETLTQLLSH